MSGQQSPNPYLRSAWFAEEEAAGKVYFAIEEKLGRAAGDIDLSVYRFIRCDNWHVPVVGDAPPRELRQEIETALDTGESVMLDRETRRWLRQRRVQQSKHGPWVGRHYRSGRGFRFEG